MKAFLKYFMALLIVFALAGCIGEDYDVGVPTAHLDLGIASIQLKEANVSWKTASEEVQQTIDDIQEFAALQDAIKVSPSQEASINFEENEKNGGDIWTDPTITVTLLKDEQQIEMESYREFQFPDEAGNYVIVVEFVSSAGSAKYVGNVMVGSNNSAGDSESNKNGQADKDTVNETSNTQQTEQASNTNNSAGEKDSGEIFYGKWTIDKVLAYGPVGSYSEDDINQIIGKKLVFSKESASCFGDHIESLNYTAYNPSYKKTVISKNDFESSYRVPFDKSGIKADSMTEIIAADNKGNGCTFFIMDDDTLMLYGGGVFFELKRI